MLGDAVSSRLPGSRTPSFANDDIGGSGGPPLATEFSLSGFTVVALGQAVGQTHVSCGGYRAPADC